MKIDYSAFKTHQSWMALLPWKDTCKFMNRQLSIVECRVEQKSREGRGKSKYLVRGEMQDLTCDLLL